MAVSVHAFDEGFGVMSKNPSVSPFGNEIAFEADFDGPLNIWISTMGGGSLSKLTNGLNDPHGNGHCVCVSGIRNHGYLDDSSRWFGPCAIDFQVAE